MTVLINDNEGKLLIVFSSIRKSKVLYFGYLLLCHVWNILK